MTYREKIQDMQSKLQDLYNDAEWLRDYATENEKFYWNEFRRLMYGIGTPLSRLDNSLHRDRATMNID